MSTLFDASFLRTLEGLRIRARMVPGSGRHAEQRSQRRGTGIEFADLRPYAAGDDFRGIDWHVFQRLDRVFLRLYLEEQDLPVYFLLDQSRSMALPGVGARSKSHAARQAVAALSYVTLHHLDRVSVLPFAGGDLRPLPAVGGKRAFHRLLAFLEDLPAAGPTGLVDALARLRQRRLRRGLCVLVSDLFDPAGPDAVLEVLAEVPHRLLVIRPVHPGEDTPQLHGDVHVVDCETGADTALTVDEAFRREYRAAYRTFAGDLQQLGTRRSIGLLTLHTDHPVVPQLATLFPQGVMQA